MTRLRFLVIAEISEKRSWFAWFGVLAWVLEGEELDFPLISWGNISLSAPVSSRSPSACIAGLVLLSQLLPATTLLFNTCCFHGHVRRFGPSLPSLFLIYSRVFSAAYVPEIPRDLSQITEPASSQLPLPLDENFLTTACDVAQASLSDQLTSSPGLAPWRASMYGKCHWVWPCLLLTCGRQGNGGRWILRECTTPPVADVGLPALCFFKLMAPCSLFTWLIGISSAGVWHVLVPFGHLKS